MHYSYLYSSFYNVQNSTEGYNKINNWPLNFLRTGSNSNGCITYRIGNGRWWSNINYSTGRSYGLLTDSSNAIPEVYQYGFSRGLGFAIRCVTREG